ncbi:unnamed protein product [Adineta ricciae]|uniref:Uncharacterized protein n=2 Tax=Adineta ricciae TaxID=249248 RepID=A0A813XGV9_ADIRI|nr:unnamed protein product [Adineta ricciae]
MQSNSWRTKVWPNRRLMLNNCLLFLGFFFTITFVRTTYFQPADSYSYNLQSSISYKTFFQHLQSYSYPVSCQKLFESDPNEIERANNLLRNKTNSYPAISNEKYHVPKSLCINYRSERFNQPFHYRDSSINQQFPIAFTILLHDNVEQFERLLRLIYRPQNIYCIHVDSGAERTVFESVRSIANCFDNIFLTNKRERVLYATFRRLQADLNCMEDLLKYPSWKYLLNIAGSELPLRTNSELVKILSIYRGFNDIEGIWRNRNVHRFEYVFKYNNNTRGTHESYISRTDERKKPPPHNISIFKGSAYGVFSRGFVNYIQTNPIAKDLLNWSQDTYSPDEHVWATLNYNTHLKVPGGSKAQTDPAKWTGRFCNWGEYQCHGTIIRGICVFGTADLPLLAGRHELIANKFYLKVDPIAYQCFEELLVNRSKFQLPLANAQIYRQMSFLSSP